MIVLIPSLKMGLKVCIILKYEVVILLRGWVRVIKGVPVN